MIQDNLGSVLGDVSRLLRKAFDERARSIGVTRPQWRVLTKLVGHEGINQGNLAEMLDLEPITVCRMVDRLQEAGLVERRADPADRRAWQLFLTPRARPIVEELRALADPLFHAATEGLSATELEQLHRSIAVIHSNLIGLTAKDQKEAAHG